MTQTQTQTVYQTYNKFLFDMDMMGVDDDTKSYLLDMLGEHDSFAADGRGWAGTNRRIQVEIAWGLRTVAVTSDVLDHNLEAYIKAYMVFMIRSLAEGQVDEVNLAKLN